MVSDREARRRVEAVLGKNPFNPYARRPTPAEVRSLLHDGMVPEDFNEDHDPMKKRAVLSIGIPGSGKSTVMKMYAEKIGAAYVSSDETRGMVTGNEADVSRDAEVWPLIYQRLHDALDSHDVVVLDSTASNYEKRRDIIRHIRQKAEVVEGIFFDISLGEAKRRNSERDRKVPEEIIEAMYQQLVDNPPGDEFDSIVVVGD